MLSKFKQLKEELVALWMLKRD